jgi:UDP-N-acetylglucosamine--N-acetylmuramyl-(pentapeptide) pyrophosphoryl-undecaprenol N-acetylglucosamine transferase
MAKFNKIVITGGGSGGHVSVASGLIEAIKKKNQQLFKNLVYIGGDLGMVGEKYGDSLEQRRFKNVDFRTRFIRAGKFQRKLSPTSIKLLFRTLLGVIDSYRVLKQEKPDLIFSTGGFVTVPVCIVGWLKGIPIYLHEQTASVGLANRIVGKFAKKIYIAFDSSQKYFRKEKTELVGNIVRDAVITVNTTDVSDEFKDIVLKNPDLPLIYISGGGLGSHIINSKVLSEIEDLLSKYRVILQTGNNKTFNDYKKALEIKNKLTSEKQDRFLPIRFIDDNNIGYVYHTTNLFLGRAGANTVYEIAVLGKASIFIPIPWVTNNEQYENAKVLENLGLSRIIKEDEFKDINLVEILENEIRNLPKERIDSTILKTKFPTNAVEKVLNDMYT